MIITFSSDFTADPQSTVEHVVDFVGTHNYRLTWQHDSPIGNLLPVVTWARGRRVRFTISTRDARAYGSRLSASGRHMRKASWQAHRDVLRKLFAIDPNATIRTAFATYRGQADFENSFERTADHNVGSVVAPRKIIECSV